MGAEGFWDNPDAAKSIVAEVKTLKAITDPIEAMLRGVEDVKALYELGSEAGDQDALNEADQMLAELDKKYADVELQTLLDGPNDPKNCFFSIQAGQGGTEAQDWAEMLL